jgi:hypothetical protein
MRGGLSRFVPLCAASFVFAGAYGVILKTASRLIPACANVLGASLGANLLNSPNRIADAGPGQRRKVSRPSSEPDITEATILNPRGCSLKPLAPRACGAALYTIAMPGTDINGFYAGYFAAAAGEGVAIFVLRNGILTGVDAGGITYDGTFEEASQGEFVVEATVKIPPLVPSIIGITGGEQGTSYSIEFKLPSSFLDQPFIRIETPGGPVNMRWVKLRDLN